MSALEFGLNFPGRDEAVAAAESLPIGRLRMVRRARDPAVTLVEGDNLEVLKLLRAELAGTVDAIYIDPPYNRGRDFVYRGIYSATAKAWATAGPRRSASAPARRSASAPARRSAPWLAMMLPRLIAARALLGERGVLFASIDDAEVHHLRMLLDEVFGRERFIAQIVVVSNRGGRDYLPVAVTHEYVLCYGNGDDPRVAELPKAGPLPLHDATGPYELRELRNRNPRFTPTNRPNLDYPIWVDPAVTDDAGCHPVGLSRIRGGFAVLPRNRVGAGSVWRWGRDKLAAAIVAGDPGGSGVVAKRRRDGGHNIYEKCRKQTTKARALWDDASLRSEQGSIELRAALGAALFDHPKPIELVRRCVELGCPEDGLVLDFFAGSGTTALAVDSQNRRDGGRRRCVLVQWPEPTPTSSSAHQAGLTDVAAIAAARLEHAFGAKRVARRVWDAAPTRARR